MIPQVERISNIEPLLSAIHDCESHDVSYSCGNITCYMGYAEAREDSLTRHILTQPRHIPRPVLCVVI